MKGFAGQKELILPNSDSEAELWFMQDPFDDVKEEVQSSLQATANLLSSYRRIRSTAANGSEELKVAREEVSTNTQLLYMYLIC